MNFSRLLYSFFSFVVGIFFILLGILSLIIPFLPSTQAQIIQFTLENPYAISLFGLVFLLIGTAVIVNIFLAANHRYYRLRSGTHAVEIDETLIQQCLDSYWQELFPDTEVPNRVFLKNNRIHLTANFPALPLEEQKPLLHRIEKDLEKVFRKTLGYEKDFFFSASFRELKK